MLSSYDKYSLFSNKKHLGFFLLLATTLVLLDSLPSADPHAQENIPTARDGSVLLKFTYTCDRNTADEN